MRFSEDFLEDLRRHFSLEEFVSRYIPLKQKGRRFWGCCPFHHEKTPSFSVNSETQMFYCFGCHKAGTVIQFAQGMENLEYQEAIAFLAEQANIPLPAADNRRDQRPGSSREERERMLEANREAARYFHSLLWTQEGADILTYLYGRGLNDRDIRHFGLGASPKGWDSLIGHLGGLGYEKGLLQKAGLAVERDGRFFDMFRNRAMFPIIDARGRILGFGGRAMGDAQPKYMNTPETPVFNKRHNLYGLNFATKERELGHLVLVEGYMDTVSLRKNGVQGVVATLGTALTQDQARLIKRYAPEVWISYDGDPPGRKAALRALDIFDEFDDLRPKVLDYPPGQDPDDFVKARGREGFEALTRYDAPDYRMIRAKDDLDMTTQEGMTQYAMRCCEIIKKIKEPVVQENYLRRLIDETGYDRETLTRQIGMATVAPSQSAPRPYQPARREQTTDVDVAQSALLTLLAENRVPAGMIGEEDFSDESFRRFAKWLLSGKDVASYLDAIEDEGERSRAAGAVSYSPIPENREECILLAQSTRQTIRNARYRARIDAIQEEIKTADPSRKAELYDQMVAMMRDMET